MSAFEKIIGYENIKQELMQICDMIHNKEIYQQMGAKLPQGVLLYGDPGLGKTLMAQSFIEESGLQAYTIRRSGSESTFLREIDDTFTLAMLHSPSIVFLDDIDKFANDDEDHCDSEAYVAVQAEIDNVKGMDVFVIATANSIHKLPDSLLRMGRFDRKINFYCPSEEDVDAIIRYYIKDKKLDKDVDFNDISAMINYSSCAELETIMNEAAINAAYKRKDCVGNDDLIEAVLKHHYESPSVKRERNIETLRKISIHEAGHIVVSEIISDGSVGFASVRSLTRRDGEGFIRNCKHLYKVPERVLMLLGGKVAVDLYYPEDVAAGYINDIDSVYKYLRDAICDGIYIGVRYLENFRDESSETRKSNIEAVIHAEVERLTIKVKEILLKNKAFLEKTAEALLEKENLLHSDIRKIKESVEIIPVSV